MGRARHLLFALGGPLARSPGVTTRVAEVVVCIKGDLAHLGSRCPRGAEVVGYAVATSQAPGESDVSNGYPAGAVAVPGARQPFGACPHSRGVYGGAGLDRVRPERHDAGDDRLRQSDHSSARRTSHRGDRGNPETLRQLATSARSSSGAGTVTRTVSQCSITRSVRITPGIESPSVRLTRPVPYRHR